MEEQRKEIIKSLAGVAWADGEVTEEERALLFAVCLQLGATDQEVDELEEVPAGNTVIFSAHGVSLAVREEAERRAVVRVIARVNGNVARAAEVLGISRPTLYDLMNRFGLKKETST